VPPWRIRVAPSGTRRVLELAAGQIAATKLSLGTYLLVESPPPDRSEFPTVKLSRARHPVCERQPIQFTLRLPIERRCANALATKCSDVSPRHARHERDSRVTTPPSAGT
jgi:hypothetical protein